MSPLFSFLTIPALLAIFSGLVMFGLLFYFWQSRSEARARSEVRERLEIRRARTPADGGKAAGKVARKIAARSDRFYSLNDPKQKRMMQNRLMQAGYFHPNGLGFFFAARFASAFVMLLAGMALIMLVFTDMAMTNKLIVLLLFLTLGYFVPNLYLDRRIKARASENRAGFPDVMDLMVVAAEAGLTTEASIERIAQEIRTTYPVLSQQLALAAIEIRAGKPLDESLRTFGERVGLEEVRGFATMIQQSKELGTSVSDALRVYSDEMRHKRMMAAEEKAYALPAKLSVPVTAFILPIVIGVAVIPTVVRLMNQ